MFYSLLLIIYIKYFNLLILENIIFCDKNTDYGDDCWNFRGRSSRRVMVRSNVKMTR